MPLAIVWTPAQDALLHSLANNSTASIIAISRQVGVSRSCAQRRLFRIRSPLAMKACTEERASAGTDPLPAGHGISLEAIAFPLLSEVQNSASRGA